VPADGVAWCDLGSPDRVLLAQRRLEQLAAVAAR
jgi:hypothetical protein